MKRLSFLFVVILLHACSGIKDLGWHKMPDGTQFGGYSIKNPGVSGPDVTALQTFRCPVVGECKSAGNFSGSAPGALEVGVAGMGAATVQATGAGIAAHLLRPTRINESTNVSVDVDQKTKTGDVSGGGVKMEPGAVQMNPYISTTSGAGINNAGNSSNTLGQGQNLYAPAPPPSNPPPVSCMTSNCGGKDLDKFFK